MNLLQSQLGIKLKKNRTKRNFKKLTCNPKQITSKNIIHNDSCLDYNTLTKLKNIWNKRHPDSKIISKKKIEIWKLLKEKMANVCDNEMCWVNKSFKNKDIKSKLFAPEMPHSWKNNINEWLSSVDITNIMKQYEESHSNFKFYGPAPIDFDLIQYDNQCVWPEICNLSIKKCLEKNINKLGFIFNTDKHYESGSHWIALFIDLEYNTAFYFDSTGNTQSSEITKLINRIVKQCNKLNINLKVDNNHGIRHQKNNTECGIYCLYFIITLLLKKHKFNHFKDMDFSDKYMEKYRHIYFNNV